MELDSRGLELCMIHILLQLKAVLGLVFVGGGWIFVVVVENRALNEKTPSS